MSKPATQDDQKHTQVGLIILGNSGVGKSFLANTILGVNDHFKHEQDLTAVTLETEYKNETVGDLSFAVYNIPGLIENDQKRIETNKKEIDKAFKAHPFSIVCYVFGCQHGRLRNEDVVAFKAIDAAYCLNRSSLVFVVNGIPTSRNALYEGRATVLLSTLTGIPANDIKVTFVDKMSDEAILEAPTAPNKVRVRAALLAVLMRARATVHEKQQDIKLEKDLIEDLKASSEAAQKKFEDQIDNNNKEIAKLAGEAQAAREKYDKDTKDLKEQLLKSPKEIIRETIHHHHHKEPCNIM